MIAQGKPKAITSLEILRRVYDIGLKVAPVKEKFYLPWSAPKEFSVGQAGNIFGAAHFWAVCTG